MGGIKDPHQNAVGLWHLENLSRWREIQFYVCFYANGGPGWRGLSSPLLSLPPSGRWELIPPASTRDSHAPHTGERTKTLRWEISSEGPRFTVLSSGRVPTPVTVWWGCSCHTPALQFPGSSRSLVVFKMMYRATANPFSCFPTVFCKQESKLGAMLAAASATLLSALCLSPCSHLLLSLPLWRNRSTVLWYKVSLHLYNLQISLNIFLPQGIAACLMKSANLPAPQASLIRHLWYDKLLNNIIYFSWDIAREGYVSRPAETSSMMDETSGNIILAGCLSFNIKHTCVWAGPEFFSNLNSCKDILISLLWCN